MSINGILQLKISLQNEIGIHRDNARIRFKKKEEAKLNYIFGPLYDAAKYV